VRVTNVAAINKCLVGVLPYRLAQSNISRRGVQGLLTLADVAGCVAGRLGSVKLDDVILNSVDEGLSNLNVRAFERSGFISRLSKAEPASEQP
jgi:hypothetical protein